jgi:hypothetical protein
LSAPNRADQATNFMIGAEAGGAEAGGRG